MQHIAEAESLTKELGGTDQDVKRYFFTLTENKLREILDEYGRKYGTEKQEYAKNTFQKWRTGATKMSGLVASRLFDLLPPRMPLEKKYELTHNLWSHLGPKSSQGFTIGSGVSIDEIAEVIGRHVEQVVVGFQIPEAMERRFTWLSAGDVRVKQQLLNHLQELEKRAAIEGARVQVPTILNHLRSEKGRYTHSAVQVLRIGNHEIRLEFDPNSDRIVTGTRPRQLGQAAPSHVGFAWIIWVVAGLIILFLIWG